MLKSSQRRKCPTSYLSVICPHNFVVEFADIRGRTWQNGERNDETNQMIKLSDRDSHFTSPEKSKYINTPRPCRHSCVFYLDHIILEAGGLEKHHVIFESFDEHFSSLGESWLYKPGFLRLPNITLPFIVGNNMVS
jgi:hypothetical protein